MSDDSDKPSESTRSRRALRVVQWTIAALTVAAIATLAAIWIWPSRMSRLLHDDVALAWELDTRPQNEAHKWLDTRLQTDPRASHWYPEQFNRRLASAIIPGDLFTPDTRVRLLRAPLLRELTVLGYDCSAKSAKFQNCPRLECFRLIDCHYTKLAIEQMPDLTELCVGLQKRSALPETGELPQLSLRDMPALESLLVQGASIELLEGVPGLRRLALGRGARLADGATVDLSAVRELCIGPLTPIAEQVAHPIGSWQLVEIYKMDWKEPGSASLSESGDSGSNSEIPPPLLSYADRQLANLLAAAPNLVALEIRSVCITDASVDVLAALPRLRRLSIENCLLSENGADRLCRALPGVKLDVR